MAFVRIIATCTAALLLTACGGNGFKPEDATSVTVADALPPSDPRVTPETLEAYRLGPADKVEVGVFNVPDLRTEAMVDPGGFVAMPLIGPVRAAGLTTLEFGDAVRARLDERYVRDPKVTVSLVDAVSQRVTLDGAVRAPGRYPVIGPTSLTEAIALGQGPSDYARTNEVLIFRTVEGRRYVGRFSLADIRGGRALDPRVYGGDTVVVGTNNTRLALRDIASAAPLLSLFFLIP